MTQRSIRLIHSITLLFLITSLGACNLANSDENQQAIPQGVIQAEFHDLETGDPLVEQEVLVSTMFQGDQNVIEQGTIETDTNGSFEGVLTNQTEVVVSKIVFHLTYEGEAYTFEEDTNLQLRSEGELDRVQFSYAVGQEEDEEEEEEEEE